jgi:copper(I)-binding protein
MRRSASIVHLVLVVALGIPLAHASSSALTVEFAWVREGPPVAKTLAAYMTIKNSSMEPISIQSVRSTEFNRVELHRSMMADGMAIMKKETQVEIPARGRIKFKPGGRHIMLIGPSKALKVGDVIRLYFLLGNGDEVPIDVPVRREPPE